MKKTTILVFIIIFFHSISAISQTIKGKITSNNVAIPFANIVLEGVEIGVSANEDGIYEISNSPIGHQYIIVSSVGMITKRVPANIIIGMNTVDVNLTASVYSLDQVVVTGTRTFRRKTESPVIVNVIDSRQLENVKACNLAEGLNFQPGIRVEMDCQTCNYTQLRMNGLTGGYSQILINGRPIFSPLTGLYGMEQIPINMIDRIEIVRGGGSSLYGSSAIGGIVNVITKLADQNEFSFGYDYGIIDKLTDNKVIYGNTTVVADNKSAGATIYINNRQRDWFDYNDDNYSELPLLKDNTFGASLFILPSANQKLEINMGSLHEYRYGGEMLTGAAHFALQAEERMHDIFLGNIDYQLNFNDGASSLISYLAGQQTKREHYTGVRPGVNDSADADHLANPPYGTSLNITKQLGFQLNHRYDKFIGTNIFTVGSEYVSDDVVDEISAYDYLIDQKIRTIGVFVQSDWNLTKNINLLSGARFDKHSLLDNIIMSPRMSLLCKFKNNTQFRLSYSTGFRAPQSFDSDLHIAFAGGGVSMIKLANDLEEERSNSISASVNYDKATSYYIYGFTFESFLTRLADAFYQDPIGDDEFGEVFVKRNGDGAIVKGLNMEFRANFYQRIQVESGLTLQKSLYNKAVNYSDMLPAKTEFLRTPTRYGYTTINYSPSVKFNFSMNLVHTGTMELLHLAGSPEQTGDEYKTSEVFNVIGLKATYIQEYKKIGVGFEYSIGIKNLSDSYQSNFDSGKNRDSNFVYGPSTPRSFYFGLKLKSLK
tara:strand:- start:25435 stop:27741 length:2307 start_codon:yes stop_codon:yes gene_type:complete